MTNRPQGSGASAPKHHRRGVQAKADIGETRIPGFSAPDRLSIADLTIDPALQMRETLNDGVIDDYAAALGRGDPFPPIIVFQEGDTYRVADGFHRVNAHKRAQLTHINAEIHVGGFTSALRYALTANAKHGMQRSEGDLRRAYHAAVGAGLVEATDTTGVQDLLRCTERWARHLTREAREAAKAERDAEIQRGIDEGKTQREIAQEVGVSVGSVNAAVQKRKTSETEHPAPAAPTIVEPIEGDDLDAVRSTMAKLQAQTAPSAPVEAPPDPASTTPTPKAPTAKEAMHAAHGVASALGLLRKVEGALLESDARTLIGELRKALDRLSARFEQQEAQHG